MTEEQKLMSMRGNNIHFARATVFHEVIPGHFLQLFMADRYRRYRRMFDTPFSVEGWACIGKWCCGTMDSQNRQKTESACWCGVCTAARASSSR
jgi:hypothetical protein